MRPIRILVAVALTALAVVPAGAHPSAFVSVVEYAFEAPVVNVRAGASVMWSWNDASEPHTVTSYRGARFDSGVRTSGTFTAVSDVSPTAYRCVIHSSLQPDGRCDGMCGAIVDDHEAPPPPVITSPASGSTVEADEVLVDGDAGGDAFEVRIRTPDGTLLGDGAVVDGRWRVPIAPPPGEVEVVAYAVDRWFNISEGSAPVRFTLKTPPLAPPIIAAPTDGEALAGEAVTLEGRVSARTTAVEALLGDAVVGTSGTDGRFFSVTAWLGEGTHRVRVVALDRDGVRSEPSAEITVRLDATRPGLTIDEPRTMSVVPLPVVVRGSASDNVSVARVIVDAYPITPGGNLWTGEATCDGCGTDSATWRAQADLRPGVYDVVAVVEDSVGYANDARARVIVL